MNPYTGGKSRSPKGSVSLTHKCPTRERCKRVDKRRARRDGKEDILMDLLVRSMNRDSFHLTIHHD